MRRREEETRKQKISEHVPAAPPQPHEEGANESSSSALPVEASLSAVSLVEAHFTVKEMIRTKSEKKKRQEDEQKRTEDAPVVSPPRVALPQAFVTSVVFLSLDIFIPVNT